MQATVVQVGKQRLTIRSSSSIIRSRMPVMRVFVCVLSQSLHVHWKMAHVVATEKCAMEREVSGVRGNQ